MVSFALDDALAAEMEAAVGEAELTRSSWLRQAVREHLDRSAEEPVAAAGEIIRAVIRVGDPP